MPRRTILTVALAACALAALTGCSGDEPVAPIATTSSASESLPSQSAAPVPEIPRAEVEAMVTTTALVAQETANYLTEAAPNGTSAQLNEAIAAGAAQLIAAAPAVAVEPAKIVTVAVNFTDMQAEPDPAKMPEISESLSVDVLFAADYTCTVAVPNVSAAPGEIRFDFSAEAAIVNAEVRCGPAV